MCDNAQGMWVLSMRQQCQRLKANIFIILEPEMCSQCKNWKHLSNPWIILAEVCNLKYSKKKLGKTIHYAWSWWNLYSEKKLNGIFLSKKIDGLQSLKYIFWSTKCWTPYQALPWTHWGPQSGPRPPAYFLRYLLKFKKYLLL